MENRSRKAISVTRADICIEGLQLAKVQDVEILPEKREVKINSDYVKREILRATFELENGQTRYKDMIFAMTADSELGKFIKAIKGYLPDEIEDLVGEVLGEEIMVNISKNVKNNRTYYNIVGFKNKNENIDKTENETNKSLRERGLSTEEELEEFLNAPGNSNRKETKKARARSNDSKMNINESSIFSKMDDEITIEDIERVLNN